MLHVSFVDALEGTYLVDAEEESRCTFLIRSKHILNAILVVLVPCAFRLL